MDLVHKRHFELIEIHTLPRGLIGLTLKTLKGGKINLDTYWRSKWKTIPKGSYTLYISKTEEVPLYASFVNATQSLRVIHKRVDEVREALRTPSLKLYIEGEEVPLYQLGMRYEDLGIYNGMGKDDKGIYYAFSNNKTIVKQYID